LALGVERPAPERDCGLGNPPSPVRPTGHTLQIYRLHHAVAAGNHRRRRRSQAACTTPAHLGGADGTRTVEETAAVASVELDYILSGESVRFLVETEVVPAGI
jgi:hypothetical protein